MVIHAVDQMPNLPWQRPAGLSIIFMSAIAALRAAARPGAASAHDCGGRRRGAVGRFLANTLEQTLSTPGAWAFVTFLLFSGIVLVFDRFLIEGWYTLLRIERASSRADRDAAGQATAAAAQRPTAVVEAAASPARPPEETVFTPLPGANVSS